MAGKEFYSVQEVAHILGLSPDRVYEYLRTGRLYGMRLSQHSAWRIPAAELERLKGTGLEKTSTQVEPKPVRWSGYLDMAAQIQKSLSCIGPKDWAIWGLPDSGEPPLTSEAGLRIWSDRGKLMVKLMVEKDNRFPLFLSRLKNVFPEFKSYDRWRESLNDFVGMCWTLAQEILTKAESETGLILSSIPVMGKGHLLNVPKFTYEFALDNYDSEKQPDLEILQNDPNCYKLVPEGLPDYILAIGSEDEMDLCQKVTISLSSRYIKDERIGEIRAKAAEIKNQSTPFLTALSAVLKEATSNS